jgi:hypothetical protein
MAKEARHYRSRRAMLLRQHLLLGDPAARDLIGEAQVQPADVPRSARHPIVPAGQTWPLPSPKSMAQMTDGAISLMRCFPN